MLIKRISITNTNSQVADGLHDPAAKQQTQHKYELAERKTTKESLGQKINIRRFYFLVETHFAGLYISVLSHQWSGRFQRWGRELQPWCRCKQGAQLELMCACVFCVCVFICVLPESSGALRRSETRVIWGRGREERDKDLRAHAVNSSGVSWEEEEAAVISMLARDTLPLFPRPDSSVKSLLFRQAYLPLYPLATCR